MAAALSRSAGLTNQLDSHGLSHSTEFVHEPERLGLTSGPHAALRDRMNIIDEHATPIGHSFQKRLIDRIDLFLHPGASLVRVRSKR